MQRDYAAAGNTSGAEKLGLMRKLYLEIRKAEELFARDFTQPFEDVRCVRQLLPKVETDIHRLEAGQRRSKPWKRAP